MQDTLMKRRQALKWLVAGGLAASLPIPRIQAATSPHQADIVIVGSGLAGLSAAHRLRRQLPKARITVVDGKREHNYQPGYTLLATGVWHDTRKVKTDNARLMPSGVQWVQDEVTEVDPERRLVYTRDGSKLTYDYLVMAPGLRLGYERIEGLDTRAFGHHGLGSVYHSPEVALATWQAMDVFRKQGGRAVMTLAPTDMKCAGAPLKMTFMLADRVHQAGTGNASKIDFYAPKTSIFSVPVVAQNVLERWANLAVSPQVHYKHLLSGVDIDSRTAHFTLADGSQIREHYDFLHVVPPMYAPDMVFHNQALANATGWLNVNERTLQHRHYPNIFGLGDVNGTARGKTAATVKKSAPVVVHNLIRTMNGQEPDALFDGYTSCPLLVREGSAMLVEFNGKGELTPTLPMVDPLQESYLAWYLEEVMLKPAYMTVLKGRA